MLLELLVVSEEEEIFLYYLTSSPSCDLINLTCLCFA